MKLKKMTATFGKLQRQTLELKAGLNIIEAPNEAGKSTWGAFLRAMLYGIDTKERDKKGVIAEKNRYQPWAGGSMEGSIDLSWNGRDITLRRTGKGNSPFSQFQAVYTGTEEPVPGLSADNAGELLTGVGREVFERSAFVGQSALAVTGSAELERRISAIVSSGQEDVSYSETEQQLRNWKNRRYSNQKNGLIPRLEEERAAVTATLDRLEQANRQAAAARAQIRELEQEQAALEEQAAAHRALSNAQARQRYDAAKAERDAAQAAMDSLQQELSRRGARPDTESLRRIQGELSYLNTLDSNIKQARRETETTVPPTTESLHPVFSGMDPSAARQRARADYAAADPSRQKFPLGSVLGLCAIALLAMPGAVLPVFFPGVISKPLSALWLIACGAALCILGTVRLVSTRKRAAVVARLLSTYGVQHPTDILDQAEDYAKRWETAEQERTEAAVRMVTLERMEAEREELSSRLLKTVRAFAPEVTDLFGVSAAVSLALSLGEKELAATLRLESAEKILQAITAQGVPEAQTAPDRAPELSQTEVAARLGALRSELQRLNEQLALAQGEMNSLGDPAALQAQLGRLENDLTRRREEYDAILTAMEALTEANAELQERMSPALNARSGELLSQLTGGAYDQVALTREFEALAGQCGDVTPKKLLSLSRGTADQLYLAVRLAVCDLVLPGDDPAMLVLDDALVNFDDERLNLALDLLRDLAQQRQVLLFTCQSRERLWLSGASDVNVIRLQS